jgi:hypothetical protein
MTAPLPLPPSPWDEGFTPWGTDQAAVLEAEMETFRDRTRPSRLERLVLSAAAVVTETARVLAAKARRER